MLALYDEKEILMEYIECERYEAAQEAAQKAKRENARETAIQMVRAGKLSFDEISQFFPTLTPDDVKELQKELL